MVIIPVELPLYHNGLLCFALMLIIKQSAISKVCLQIAYAKSVAS